MNYLTQLRTIYERLKCPVNANECTIHNLLTNQPAFLNPLEDLKFKCSPVELYPQTQFLNIGNSIPNELWDEDKTREQIHHIWASLIQNYKLLSTKDTYYSNILHDELDSAWCIPLFGYHYNSIQPILHITLANALTQSNESLNFLFHAIAIIILQFYLIEREQWLEACAPVNEPLYDQLPPYLCMFFMRYDVKRGCFIIPIHELDSPDKLKEACRKYDYISLVASCLIALSDQINEYFLPFTPSLQLNHKKIERWCRNKLFVTKTQFFVTSRFIHCRVYQYRQLLLKSLQLENTPSAEHIVENKLTKHFKLIKHHKMHEVSFHGRDPLRNKHNVYNLKNLSAGLLAQHQTRIPVFLAHFWFNPTEPVTIISENTPNSLIWLNPTKFEPSLCHLAFRWLFIGLLECSKLIDATLCNRIRKSLNSLLRQWKSTVSMKIKLNDLERKQCQSLNLIRVRYGYTIDKYRMLTNLANALSLQNDSEFNPEHISMPQWKSLLKRLIHQPSIEDLMITDDVKDQIELQCKIDCSKFKLFDLSNKKFKLKRIHLLPEQDTFEYAAVIHSLFIANVHPSKICNTQVNWWVG